MNIPSDTIAESQVTSAPSVAMPIAPARLLYWTVRRELWENRSIYLAPLAVGAVAVIGFSVFATQLPAQLRAASGLDGMKQHALIEQRFMLVSLLLMFTEMVVAAFYCLDALYGERRDRSVLFWKSLPVSDFMVVLSKAIIPILVIPLVTFAVTVVTQFIIMVIGSAVLSASGMDGRMLWTHMPFIRTSMIHFYHLVVFHGLWYAPFIGWLLMVSAWAKRTPLLWAVFPPLAIGLFEKFAFTTSHFGNMLLRRLGGEPSSPDSASVGGMTMDMLAPDHAGHIFVTPGLWIGLIITAAFLFAAARLRRSRAVN